MTSGYYEKYGREYFNQNREKFAHYNAMARDKLRLEMIEAYGGECKHCHIAVPEVLTLDHINNDAHVEKEQFGLNARGGHKHYARLKREGWPKDRFQLLCYNCNAIKENSRRREEMIARQGEFAYADRQAVQAKIGVKRNNTSGLKGVFWNEQKQRWQARITVDYRPKHLGFYVNPLDAALAYREAARMSFGEAANLQSDEELVQAVAALEKISETTVNAEDLGL